jgi:hypothetical protein
MLRRMFQANGSRYVGRQVIAESRAGRRVEGKLIAVSRDTYTLELGDGRQMRVYRGATKRLMPHHGVPHLDRR